jgi:hypothetical protein
MDSTAWSNLIRQIPADLQELLTVTTQAGVEISLQSVMRIEDKYVVLRGRLAGTNDQDKIFIVPYDGIVYAGFQRPISASAIGRIYGEGVPEPPPVVETPAPEPVTPEPVAECAPTPVTPPPAPKAATKPKIAKAELLERLRARNVTTS